jgi:hypothetical protein
VENGLKYKSHPPVKRQASLWNAGVWLIATAASLTILLDNKTDLERSLQGDMYIYNFPKTKIAPVYY